MGTGSRTMNCVKLFACKSITPGETPLLDLEAAAVAATRNLF